MALCESRSPEPLCLKKSQIKTFFKDVSGRVTLILFCTLPPLKVPKKLMTYKKKKKKEKRKKNKPQKAPPSPSFAGSAGRNSGNSAKTPATSGPADVAS